MKQPKTLPIKMAAPIGIGFGDLLGDCPHCQQPVALVPVSLFRFIVRCNNRKCTVRPRTWKMATPHDARAAWRQYLKTKIHPKLSSLRRPRTSPLATVGRERPEGASAGVVVKSPNVEASEPPTPDVNRDSGTGCANGGSLR